MFLLLFSKRSACLLWGGATGSKEGVGGPDKPDHDGIRCGVWGGGERRGSGEGVFKFGAGGLEAGGVAGDDG